MEIYQGVILGLFLIAVGWIAYEGYKRWRGD